MIIWYLILSLGLLLCMAFVILFAAIKNPKRRAWQRSSLSSCSTTTSGGLPPAPMDPADKPRDVGESSKCQHGLIAILLLLLLPVLAYLKMGHWSELQHYAKEKARHERARELLARFRSPQQVIDTLRAKLQKDPASPKGWYLLGRIYESQGQWRKATAAFAKAYALGKPNEPTLIHYAESLWQSNHHTWSPEVRALYQEALTKNPNQPDALTMLAMDAYLKHDYAKAIGYWKQLLQQVPAHSEEAAVIQKAIVKAQRMLGSSRR